LSRRIGEDGYHLLVCIEQAAQQGLEWLQQVAAVQTLEQIWAQQYRITKGQAHRLTPQERAPVGAWLRSPYERDVRDGRKRTREWIGYQVHLTQGCEDDVPHLMTQVATAPATPPDHQALDAIQADLAAHDRLPAHQLVDAGSVSAKRILHSLDTHTSDLIGPVHPDPRWQARTYPAAPAPGAVEISQFAIDWGGQQVTCPQGQRSISWHRGPDAKGASIVPVFFAQHVCQACPLHHACPDARSTGRSMTLRFPQARHAARQTARTRQQTDAFTTRYRRRAGSEGTFSQTTRNTGLRRARYRGMPKTHRPQIVAATATNIVRLVSWLDGVPFAKTRTSRFAALAA
jgi:Transposase DDE domain